MITLFVIKRLVTHYCSRACMHFNTAVKYVVWKNEVKMIW